MAQKDTSKLLLVTWNQCQPRRLCYVAATANLNVVWIYKLQGRALTIQPPATGSERKQQPIDGWCIRVWEESSGDLEWILFTSVPVTDDNSALIQIDWYTCRWLIEEYHKCLKTGCAIEK